MLIMKVLLYSFLILLASCTNNNSAVQNKKNGGGLLEDQEYDIKDSPSFLKQDSTILYTGWYYVADSSKGYKRQLDQSEETYYVDPRPILNVKNFTTLKIYESSSNGNNYFGLEMRFDKQGTESWSNATLIAEGYRLAFILQNRLLQVTLVNSQITSGLAALNRGVYSRQELEIIRSIIESEK